LTSNLRQRTRAHTSDPEARTTLKAHQAHRGTPCTRQPTAGAPSLINIDKDASTSHMNTPQQVQATSSRPHHVPSTGEAANVMDS
jgi:hypothetical protein